MRLFDYEKQVLDALEKHKRIYVLKATALGLTILLLRYVAWRYLHNDEWKGKKVVIVTGPREGWAIDLIRRLKALFSPDITFETKETVIELNGCRIEAFSSLQYI